MSKKEWGFDRKTNTGRGKQNQFGRTNIIGKPVSEKVLTPKVDVKKYQSVFISYAREDLGLVKPLVVRLKNLDINIVWDQDFLSGIDFEDKIRSSIENAAVVIVVWSPVSIRSRFVRDEAALASRDDKLAPVITDNLAMSEIPLGFGSLQTTRITEFELISQGLLNRGLGPRPSPEPQSPIAE